MGLVILGFVPTPLGEIIEYTPTLNETLICLGIWALACSATPPSAHDDSHSPGNNLQSQ